MNTPIVFAMDDNYAMPTSVALGSILKYSKNKNLEFYVLYHNSLSCQSKQMLQKAIETFGNHNRIVYLNVEGMLHELKSTISHISVATFYRILLPRVLDKYNQCLYLDGDIVAVDDISNILEMKLPQKIYIAGVQTVMLQTARKKVKDIRAKQLGIADVSQYINAGVTLLNLKALRENNCVEKMIQLISKGFPLQDQDILNKVCFGKIKNIHPRYNVMPITLNPWSGRALRVYGKAALFEARSNPCIIHYADKYKPWRFSNVRKCELWDNVYKELYDIKDIHREKIGIHDRLKNFFLKLAHFICK